MKKAITAAFVVLLLSMAGWTNAVAQTITVDGLNYSMNDDGVSVTVIGFADGAADTVLVIPNAITQWGNSYPVTAIGNDAFNSRGNLTSVSIGNSVTSIGGWAFGYCYNLSSVSFGKNVTHIRGYAFCECGGLTSITLPSSLTHIEENAFVGCSGLTSITIPNSVIYIGWYAFGWCSNLSTLNYNATNCSLDWSWLEDDNSLTNLNIGDNVQVIPEGFVHDRSSLVGELVIPEFVTHIGSNAFENCSGFTGDLTISNTVTSIGNSAFRNCTGFTGSLDIPNGVQSIGSNVFENCSGFTGSLTIPNSVTYIGDLAFSYCTGFSGTLTLGMSLNEIGTSAFFGACENFSSFNVLTETPSNLGTNVFTSVDFGIPVTLPCGSLSAYQEASGWSTFTNLQETDPCQWYISVTANPQNGGTVSGAGIYEQGQICTLTATPNEDYAFVNWMEDGIEVSTEAEYSFTVEGNRNLVARFTHPDFIVFTDPNVEAICVDRWDGNHDGYLSYAEAAAVTTLDWAFEYNDDITSFDELQYFTGLTSLNEYEFYSCDNLASIILPDSLTTISYSAFYCCYALTSIVIPENVAYIGGWAFAYCYALTSITLQSITPPEISDDCPFCSVDLNNIVVNVPCNTTESYRNTYVWNWFPNYQEPDTCVYEISATINYEGAGTVSGVGTYQNGATCTMTATPSSDRMFLNWTENDQVVSTEAEYSFTVSGNRALVANFSQAMYNVMATANPNDGGSIDGIGFVMVDVENSQIPSDWSNDNSFPWFVTDYNPYNGSYCMVSSNFDYHNTTSSLETTMEFHTNGSIEFYSRISSESGWDYGYFYIDDVQYLSESGSGDWTQHSFNVTAGSHVFRWSYEKDGSVSNGDDCYFIDDIRFFGIDNNQVFEIGETCTLNAISHYGYTFENWTENDTVVSTDAEFAFTVTGDRDLVANFIKVPFTITATPNFEDRGTVSGAGEYVLDTTCTLTATPYQGHNFEYWMENGEVVSTDATYTFTVDGPRDLVALFSAHVADIIVFADPNVKAVCVNNWDTDGDGELTYDEAAAVTDLGRAFEYNDVITSFDELQYFTGLTYINNYEFYDCYSLTSMILPESVTSIYYMAFGYCYSLTGNLTIGENVSYMDDGAFAYTNFTSLNYNAINCDMGTWIYDNREALTNLHIGEQVESIPYAAFQDFYNVSGEIVVPNSVTYIGDNAFEGCSSITSITLPLSLTIINNYVFNGCGSLASINIPEGVTYIGVSAFNSCSSLPSIELPSSLETIDDFAFNNCSSLISIVIPNSVTFIGLGAFEDCSSLSSLTLSTSLVSISNQTFYGCSGLTGTLTLPASVNFIGNYAFEGCSSMTGLVLPEGLVTIGSYAFKNCSGLRGELTLPESLESVGNNAFAGCDGISTVNYNAVNCTQMGSAGEPVFYDCAFARINIGENVESIPNFAFKGCFLVSGMTVAAEVPPTIYSSTFSMISRNIPVKVPYGSGQAYRTAQYWEEFFNIISGIVFVGGTSSSWSNPSNWENRTVPSSDDEVFIQANCNLNTNATVAALTIGEGQTLTVQSGKALTVTGDLTSSMASALVIQEGAQVINATENVNATMEKNIVSYDMNGSDGWYTIASPMLEMTIDGSDFLAFENDLYRFNDANTNEEWENYKDAENQGFTVFESGRGYLYANNNTFSPTFTGVLNATEVTYPLIYVQRPESQSSGFNLVGNPFPHVIYKGNGGAIDNANLASGYYTLTNEGVWHVHTYEDAIQPGQGILVKTSEASDLTITKSNAVANAETNGAKQRMGRMNISVLGESGEDRAYAYFCKGTGLDKMSNFNEQTPSLWISDNGNKYAIAHIDAQSEAMDVMFKNKESGTFTLMVNATDIKFSYLHLIDHLTGTDIDLLVPEFVEGYNFVANGNDDESRFTIVFKMAE
ncbi:MAG: leucine-rich repeat protein [Bacteroidales bacterium]|nr:leucine-rich repeat protein [Bacteroidales bacterium]